MKFRKTEKENVEADEWSKYEKYLFWDESSKTLRAFIEARITILRMTDNGRIEGTITDMNGTTLSNYNEESVILARFAYDPGFHSHWNFVGRPSKGLFSFVIPPEHRDADYVELWVNSDNFVIQERNSLEKIYLPQGRTSKVDVGIFEITDATERAAQGTVEGDVIEKVRQFPVHQAQIEVNINGAKAIQRISEVS